MKIFYAVLLSLIAAAIPLQAAEDVSGLLYPKKDARESIEAREPAGGGVTTVVLFLSMLGAGALLFRYYQTKANGGHARLDGGHLKILESKALGGKQYLVVAECDGKRMLLGISPGMMRHLCFLNEDAPKETVHEDEEIEIPTTERMRSFSWLFEKSRSE